MYWYLLGGVLCAFGVWYIRKKYRGKREWYQAVLVLAGGFLMAFFLETAEQTKKPEAYIQRNAPGEGAEEKKYLVSAKGVMEEYPMTVTVEEEQYGAQQRKNQLIKAREELDQVFLGENKSKNEICRDLHLPQVLQKGGVEAEYTFSDYGIFNLDGTIRELPQKPVLVEVSASLECQGETCLYEFYIRAVPQKAGKKERLAEQIKEAVEKENKKTDKTELVLPAEVGGKKLSWKEPGQGRSLPFLLAAGAAAICILLSEKEKKKKNQKIREQQMGLDYPDIVGKLTLLMGAGMNPGAAWEKIALVYRKKREEKEIPSRWAYEEMLRTLYEIQDGVGERKAYENFGTRCGAAEYRKLAALLVQNMQKGSRGMCRMLEEEEKAAYEKRKARAKAAGEEAGTKLLLPMGLMLLVVLAILMIPAGMSLNIS